MSFEMAEMAEEKKNRGKDLGNVLKSKMAPAVACVVISYVPVAWLKLNMDKLQLGIVWAWIVNKILPDEGLGQDRKSVV